MSNSNADSSLKPIALIGMMGTGKTTLGKLLAKALDYDFYDTDHVIEEKEGLTIPEIFRAHGEETFRKMEKDAVKNSVTQNKRSVIATGGGAITSADTLDLLKHETDLCWIRCDVDRIFQRIKGDTNRPLMQTDDPLQTLNELLERREPLYNQAQYIVDLNNENPYATVDDLLQIFKHHRQD